MGLSGLLVMQREDFLMREVGLATGEAEGLTSDLRMPVEGFLFRKELDLAMDLMSEI